MSRFDTKGLAARRKQLGLRQVDLAQRIGATAASVGAWERGEWTPGADWLPKLACALDCRLSDLYTSASAGVSAGAA